MKHIKMGLYGEPGVGKSVFALSFPKPFFITTDGNYEFLEDFGAKEEDHIQVSNWSEFKKVIADSKLKDYKTIVIDLVEDLFKWCEYEFCKKNGYEHVSEPGFAKGYDITRNEFFINMCKVLGFEDKNVILIMHGIDITTKDRRGIEHTKHVPTNRIPDKVLDMLEGRVRYFLRCYVKAEDDGTGKLVKKRYLSLTPKENEYGILRGINENSVPTDIPLSFEAFKNAIGLEIDSSKKVSNFKKEDKVEESNVEDAKKEKISNLIKSKKVEESKVEEVKEEPKIEEEAKIEESKIEESKIEEVKKEEPKKETSSSLEEETINKLKEKLTSLMKNK